MRRRQKVVVLKMGFGRVLIVIKFTCSKIINCRFAWRSCGLTCTIYLYVALGGTYQIYTSYIVFALQTGFGFDELPKWYRLLGWLYTSPHTFCEIIIWIQKCLKLKNLLGNLTYVVVHPQTFNGTLVEKHCTVVQRNLFVSALNWELSKWTGISKCNSHFCSVTSILIE